MTEVQMRNGGTYAAQSFAAGFVQEEPMTAGPTRGIPTLRSGCPVLRTPRWMLVGGVVLVAGLTLAAIPHHPSTSQRVTDLRGGVQEMNTDIESCAGGG